MKTYTRVIIMRGISGSGKSTEAERIADINTTVDEAIHCQSPAVIVSADRFFKQPDGTYAFNPKKLAEAHAACLKDFITYVWDRKRVVIVDNTNTQLWEYVPYVQICELAGITPEFVEFVPPDGEEELLVYVKQCADRNRHGVDFQGCLKQAMRFQKRAV